jgi:serine/threonine protein kinase
MSEQLIPIGTYKGTAVAQGGFGRVYRVALPDGRPAALKWIDATADDGARRSLQHEFNVHGTLHHPQLPKVRDFGIADGRPFLVIDWIDGRSPTECSEDECDFGSLLRHLARVLWFVHRRGWVHGDLKPENLRWGLSNGEPLLYMLDFGLARPIGDDSRPRGAGTVGYCAPEFLNLQSADGRADWYSTGVILYEWLFGTRPFASDDRPRKSPVISRPGPISRERHAGAHRRGQRTSSRDCWRSPPMNAAQTSGTCWIGFRSTNRRSIRHGCSTTIFNGI